MVINYKKDKPILAGISIVINVIKKTAKSIYIIYSRLDIIFL